MDARGWGWPEDPGALEELQRELAAAADQVDPWTPGARDADEPGRADERSLVHLTVAAAFAAFPRGEGGPGGRGQRVVAAAVLWRAGLVFDERVVGGTTSGPYVAGLLALRCGPQLEGAVDALARRPDLLVVDATGRDHPRRAGLAVHLGARLGIPSVGVTNRALVARYDEPDAAGGSSSPLLDDDGLVGYAVRTRPGARPVLAHSAWRTSPELAREAVLGLSSRRWRTPLPLRAARTLARRSRAEGGSG
jgi:deoxyribonuclease V